MKHLFLLLSFLVSLSAGAQTFGVARNMEGYYTKYFASKQLWQDAEKWIAGGEWRQGFQQAAPHASVNLADFYTQYQRNPEQWSALFKWLHDTDLLAIPKGKHPIAGTTLVVSVEDSKNEPLAKRQSESHYHHIDFQYVVKGTERFGVIDHLTSQPKGQWRDDVIHYDYDLRRTRFYDSTPDAFFIFFPSDWHIAKVESPKTDDQTIRVIVIKVDYID